MSIAHALKWKPIEFQIPDPAMTAETQATMMNDAINHGYDAIIPHPVDAALLAEGIKKSETK